MVVGKYYDFPHGTKKIIPKASKIVVITGFSLSEPSGAFRAAAIR
jgi:hypothetical protein